MALAPLRADGGVPRGVIGDQVGVPERLRLQTSLRGLPAPSMPAKKTMRSRSLSYTAADAARGPGLGPAGVRGAQVSVSVASESVHTSPKLAPPFFPPMRMTRRRTGSYTALDQARGEGGVPATVILAQTGFGERYNDEPSFLYAT